MKPITILPDSVANHIAAGEVIERPASVVKELVENSLDAAAGQIDIEIGVGGKEYIRIIDNGHGMSPDNARVAFERHATSKITSTSDLAAISTLGFRGEALPSIASVAKVKLLTRPADAIVGTRVDIHGGEIAHIGESGAAPGTFIEVNDLFYKTPVRLKFLKSPPTEVGYINTVVTDEALAHADVGFSTKNNGRAQLHLPAKSDLLQRIAGLYGRDIVRGLIEVRERAVDFELHGFIGLPTCHRANRNYQKVFINQRPVKDKTISHAILQSYDTLIVKRRHAVAFLFLSLPPELVDVNVHPTKTEIRFINSQSIHHFITSSLRKTLSSAVHATIPATPPAADIPEPIPQPPTPAAPIPIQPELPVGPQPVPPSQPDRPPSQIIRWQSSESNLIATSEQRSQEPARRQTGAVEAPSFPTDRLMIQPLPARRGRFAAMKPIGQFRETYILVQDGSELCIIDQHAAHERIYYERLKQQFSEAAIDIQQLLFPVSLELSHTEQAILEEHLAQLNAYGLEVEHFGGTTYLLKAVPALLAKADHKKLLYDIIDRLVEREKAADLAQIFDGVLILMACHAAIRAHQTLQQSQILALLQQMDAAEYPYTCPHGRPTLIKLTERDLEKIFGRG